MKKFRLYWDKDKETTWLNEMAEQGYAMTHFFAGLYTFEKCEPGKYTYQIDFGDKLYGVSNDYREFMSDNNIEIVQTWGYWITLRKNNADGPFQLYTDIDSSIEHYTKIRNMFKGVAILELICFIIECIATLHNPYMFIFAVIIGLLMLVIMNAAFKTNKIIADLKEQKGEAVAAPSNPSPVLIAGLLLNGGVSGLTALSVSDYIKIPLQILAIVLMIYGIVKTCSYMGKSQTNI